MSGYVAPLRDMRFVIERVLDAPASWAGCPAYAALEAADAAEVLTHAARFAADVLEPTNAPGDLAGCTLEAGEVRTPAGYGEAYRAFVEGGWPALACDPAWDGQGLPQLLNTALYEMLVACNHGWTMYPGLLHGAYEAIEAHGSQALQERYLRKLASGEWLAAMALTEPQAGSDLGLVRTRAELRADGSVVVSGSKIFISGGDHDLTDNIVHLVLCRLADAPPGTKGLSLALVPKVLPDGSRNRMACDGLEKKMGIKGSATCQMRYDEAIGWLVGTPGRGLAAMFVMMNSARLHVAVQGLGHLERATQRALAYAHERLQMRAPQGSVDAVGAVGAVGPGAAVGAGAASAAGADPIARHPAMRRTLWRLRALTEGLRVVAYRAALLIDEAEHHEDPSRRARAAAQAALLTPVAKAFMTHHGFNGASDALQVFGGYGYVHDYGIEQQVRDARIALIYEGTNEIQAIDLVVRKLTADGGAAFLQLVGELRASAVAASASDGLAPFVDALEAQCDLAVRATEALLAARPTDPERPWRAADDFLMGTGHLLLAWAWLGMARAAAGEADADYAAAKRAAALYGVQWLLPEGEMHWRRALQAKAALPAL